MNISDLLNADAVQETYSKSYVSTISSADSLKSYLVSQPQPLVMNIHSNPTSAGSLQRVDLGPSPPINDLNHQQHQHMMITSPKSSEDPVMHRRQINVMNEQERRRHINDGFQRLRDCLPPPDNQEFARGVESRAKLLTRAADYIQQIEARLRLYEQRRQQQ